MTSDEKIVSLEEFERIRHRLRDEGLTLVQCHGVFDLVHPGHVHHLEEARAMGDRLVVTVTEDGHVRKGPGRPVFTHELRMKMLAALESVDWVLLSEHPTALEVIDVIQPDIYAKGHEYADEEADVTQNIALEREAVERYGGRMGYFGQVVFSSTRLLNEHFGALPDAAREYARRFVEEHTDEAVTRAVDAMRDCHVLVIGEPIVDEYVTCQVQGVTVKDHIPSVRWIASERAWGGAYAVARHLSTFVGRVAVAAIAGEGEELVQPDVPAGIPPEIGREIEVDPAARTVVKQRYVVRNRVRVELEKVFSVKHVADEWQIAPATRERFRDRIVALMDDYDTILVTDYGHGLLDPDTMAAIQEKAPFLALNVQTNSSNFGYNPITKYRRADTFALDENELRLAFRDRGGELAPLLRALRGHLGSDVGWLTLGSEGALSIAGADALDHVPALTLEVVDTLGAGDAFFAMSSLGARLDLAPAVSSLLGALSAAIAVNTAGNSEAVDRTALLKFAATALNV
jgi:rfaE bifunctional protein nucleotidyltransferase chain/domain